MCATAAYAPLCFLALRSTTVYNTHNGHNMKKISCFCVCYEVTVTIAHFYSPKAIYRKRCGACGLNDNRTNHSKNCVQDSVKIVPVYEYRGRFFLHFVPRYLLSLRPWYLLVRLCFYRVYSLVKHTCVKRNAKTTDDRCSSWIVFWLTATNSLLRRY